jgi:hypothetical protein
MSSRRLLLLLTLKASWLPDVWFLIKFFSSGNQVKFFPTAIWHMSSLGHESIHVIQSHSNNHTFIHSSLHSCDGQEIKSLTVGWLPCPSRSCIPESPPIPRGSWSKCFKPDTCCWPSGLVTRELGSIRWTLRIDIQECSQL